MTPHVDPPCLWMLGFLGTVLLIGLIVSIIHAILDGGRGKYGGHF